LRESLRLRNMDTLKTIYFLSLNPIHFIPYAYGLLRGYVEQNPVISKNYAWEEPICDMDATEVVAARIENPAVLFASCYVWNHNQHAAIAAAVKKRHPDCRVVFGGPHIPDKSAEYLEAHPYIDVLVHGEGEIPAEALLLAFLNKSARLAGIRGISYRQNGRVFRSKTSARLPEPLPIPSPYLNGLFDRYLEQATANVIALWETNRGCPYSCSFCDWGVRTTNKIRTHDLNKITAEIACLARQKIEDIYITDCNFGLFKRDVEIAGRLIESHQETGFPKRVRIQFAKKSNDRVYEISRMMHENGMLWGTTLSMQSVDRRVLETIHRQFLGLDNYKELKEKYRRAGIPTYTELILGLPLETRESFVRGICTLFEIGMHDDIRVFELTLLPNAPISQPASRREFGLKTKMKPLRTPVPGIPTEYVELVVETAHMTNSDWAYCLLFAETIQALHNGGYTRFLSIYLHESGFMTYAAFYEGLLKHLLQNGDAASYPFRRIRQLIQDFHDDPKMPQINRVNSQPDLMAFLGRYNPKRKAWQMWTYLWMALSEEKSTFYDRILLFLQESGVLVDETIRDLIEYQRDIMLSLDYDPITNKSVTHQYNWFEYFFQGGPLKREKTTIRYTDTHMGPSLQYEIEKGDLRKYVSAAIGLSYPYTKHHHFFHQPDKTIITVL